MEFQDHKNEFKMSLKNDLKKLETILLDKHPKLIPNLLSPELSGEKMNAILSEVMPGYILPDALIELFCWKNGTKVKIKENEYFSEIDSQSFLIPGRYLASFTEAIQCFKEKVKIFKHKGEYYFPFLFTGAENYYAIKLISQKKEHQNSDGGIYIVTKPRSKIFGNHLYYENMNIFVQSVSECYNAGGYYENVVNGRLEGNAYIVTRICYKLNPNSSYWQGKIKIVVASGRDS